MKNENKGSGGISFLGMLTILFIGLKLTGYVEWSWTWVLSPLWIGFTIGVTLIVVAIMIEKRKK